MPDNEQVNNRDNLEDLLALGRAVQNNQWIDVVADVHPHENIFIGHVNVKKKNAVHIEWGGADLDPSFYNAERSIKCGISDRMLDEQSIARIQTAINEGIPVIGICRGAQILNVVNGGVLVQHIDGHTRQHTINLFDLDGVQTHTNINVTSTHHQMMVAHKDGHIIGKDPRPTTGIHWENVNEPYEYKYVTEVVYYPKTKSLCIQPHPEWMDQKSAFVQWINDFIKINMGLDPVNFREKELSHLLKGQ